MVDDKEFNRGYHDAQTRQRPWHVKNDSRDERFNPDLLNIRYIEGYAHGYGFARNQSLIIPRSKLSFNEYYFTIGYKNGIQQENPLLSHDSYVEGQALGELDLYNKNALEALSLDDPNFLKKFEITQGLILLQLDNESRD